MINEPWAYALLFSSGLNVRHWTEGITFYIKIKPFFHCNFFELTYIRFPVSIKMNPSQPVHNRPTPYIKRMESYPHKVWGRINFYRGWYKSKSNFPYAYINFKGKFCLCECRFRLYLIYKLQNFIAYGHKK